MWRQTIISKKLNKSWFNDTLSIIAVCITFVQFFIKDSIKPFASAQRGVNKRDLKPKYFANSLNLPQLKGAPLSDSTSFGIPKILNNTSNRFITGSAAVENIVSHNGKREYLSIRTKLYSFWLELDHKIQQLFHLMAALASESCVGGTPCLPVTWHA